MRYIFLLLTLSVAMTARAELLIEEAWVRALPPTQANTAGYMTLVNRYTTPVRITGGSSDVAGAVEIHRVREVEGMMRMERVPVLTVAAGETVALAPGGLHLMLFRVSPMPREGEEVELCLQLDGSEEPVCATAAVRR